MYAVESGFKSYFCMPNSYEAWTEDNLNDLSTQFNLFVDHFISECRAGRVPIRFSQFNRMFGYIKRINSEVASGNRRVFNRCHSCGTCGIGANKSCAIDPSGNLFTCQEFTSNLSTDSAFCIGSIYSGIDSTKRSEVIESYDSIETTGLNCNTCLLDSICDGGCPANNYLITGSLRQMPKIQCQWNQTLLDGAIRVARTLGSEDNEVFLKIWGENNE